MNIPHIDDILRDSAEEYLAKIERDYENGLSSPKEYHTGLGKSLAYVEAQFALGVLPPETAMELIARVERLIEYS